jgi:hypothetical protein
VRWGKEAQGGVQGRGCKGLGCRRWEVRVRMLEGGEGGGV